MGKFVRCIGGGFIGLLLLVLVLFQTGCTVQKRQYGSGFHIEINSKGVGGFGRTNGVCKSAESKEIVVSKVGINSVKQESQKELGVKNLNGTIRGLVGIVAGDSNKLSVDSANMAVQQRELETFISEMPSQFLPASVLMQGVGSSKLLGRGNTKMILQKRVFTLHRNGTTVCGRMVGVNPNGVFIQNHHDELIGFEGTRYGKFQDSIYRSVYFVPFKELNAIHLGGSLFYKVEKMMQRVFEWIAALMLVVLALMALILSKGSDIFSNGGGWEIIGAILAIVATIVGVIVAFALAIVLLIVLFPIHWVASRFPGRYWRINKDRENGQLFIRDLRRRDWRYRVF